MAPKKKEVVIPAHDDMAQTIYDSLNKLFKDSGKSAYFLDGSESTPMDLDSFVSTGSAMLDLAISNRKNGGIAIGRITELTGLEGSGKSLVAASILRSTQESGGVGVLIDTEIATNSEFLVAQGVDMKKLVVVNKETIEDIFDAITNIITRVRESEQVNKRLVTIVVDSIAGATTKREMEADFGVQGYATDKAILLSKAMRKLTMMLGKERVAVVFTNQLRHKMNAMAFSDPWTTSGGKAIAYHSSTRIRLSQISKIKDSAGVVIGVTVKAKVDKNRLGPPHREATFDVYFNRGLDDHASWLEAMTDNKLIKKAGAWYAYTDDITGEETKLQSKEFKNFLDADPERKQRIYDKICEVSIMRYQQDIDQNSLVREDASEDE